jgi:CBS domain-containing protein
MEGGTVPIQELARDAVVTADRDTSTGELAGQMGEESVGSVATTNDETPVGIVTDRGLTELLAEEQAPLASVIQAQRPTY